MHVLARLNPVPCLLSTNRCFPTRVKTKVKFKKRAREYDLYRWILWKCSFSPLKQGCVAHRLCTISKNHDKLFTIFISSFWNACPRRALETWRRAGGQKRERKNMEISFKHTYHELWQYLPVTQWLSCWEIAKARDVSGDHLLHGGVWR